MSSAFFASSPRICRTQSYSGKMVATIFNFLPLASALLSALLAAVVSAFFSPCAQPASVPIASTAAVAIAIQRLNFMSLLLML